MTEVWAFVNGASAFIREVWGSSVTPDKLGHNFEEEGEPKQSQDLPAPSFGTSWYLAEYEKLTGYF